MRFHRLTVAKPAHQLPVDIPPAFAGRSVCRSRIPTQHSAEWSKNFENRFAFGITDKTGLALIAALKGIWVIAVDRRARTAHDPIHSNAPVQSVEGDRKMKGTRRRAFSLIEMVIVIMILGIIAAVAAPRMFDTAEQAEINTTRQQLAVLRNAIEMYRAQNGAYPASGQLPTAMSTLLNGPFPAPTIGPVRGLTGVYYDTTTTSAPVVPVPGNSNGWAYKPHNGSLRLNLDPSGSDVGRDW